MPPVRSPSRTSTSSTRAPTSGCTRSWAPTRRRTAGARAPGSPSGRRTPSGLGDRRLQRLGQAGRPAAPRGASGIWEASSRASAPGMTLQVPRRLPLPRLPGRQGRPLRLLRRDRRRARPRSSGTSTTSGGTPTGWLARGERQSLARADVDLRGPPRLLAARARGGEPLRSPTARWRRCSPSTCKQTGLHPRRAAAGHGAPVLRLLGLPDDRLLRARPAATARRRT